MSMYDWNGDGKKDLGDDYIEYRIYNEVMNDGEEDFSSSSSSSYTADNGSCSGCSTWIISILVIYILTRIFG